jgi:hypothetical protein
MQLDLSGDEAWCLATFLRRSIDADRFPLAPRLRPLKAILAKLDPRPSREPAPSVARHYSVASSVMRKKRR